MTRLVLRLNSVLLAAAYCCCLCCWASASDADYCKAVDVVTGSSYDLTGLTKTSGFDYSTSYGDFRYFLNVCGKLLARDESIQEDCRNSYACQLERNPEDGDPPKAYSLGESIDPIKVTDIGVLELTYTDGKQCRNGVNRQTTIIFHCNSNAGIGTPSFLSEGQGTEKCLYTFEWETAYACPNDHDTTLPSKPEPKDCFVDDTYQGFRYDLTPLFKASGSWLVSQGEYEYMINVCGDVTGHHKCETDHYGACQTKPSDSDFGKPLGMSSARPALDDGKLKLQMTGGSDCHNGSYSREITIIFTCLPGESLGQPKFISEEDDCEYIFEWQTSAACGEAIDPTCKITDSTLGYTTDLSRFDEKDWEATSAVKEDVDYKYLLAVCGNLHGEHPCRPDAAICQFDPKKPTIGRTLGSRGTVRFIDEDLFISYEDGDSCGDKYNSRISTDIYFICDPSAGEGQPRLLNVDDDCQYLFKWESSTACPSKEGLSGGAIFGIILLVLLSVVALYLAFGIAYRRYVKHAKGMDQIPHYDLCQAAYYTATEYCNCSRSRGNRGLQI